MKQKVKTKSNYKARSSSVDLYCSVRVHRAKGRSKSSCKVSTRGKDTEEVMGLEPELRNGWHDAHALCSVSG